MIRYSPSTQESTMRETMTAIDDCEEEFVGQSFEDYYSEGDITLDHIPDIPECRQIRQHMKERGFWPNVFHVNDHGNVDLLVIGYNGATILKSWV
jgi:hypothetical protein